MGEVWANTVDNGKWAVKVVDAEDGHGGILTVTDTETDTLVHRERVGLAYGAMFGPDVDDVAQWQDTVIDVIDNPDKRKVEEDG